MFSLMTDSTLAPLLSRAALGIVFVAHALAKPFVFTFDGTEQYFASVGFPAWTVYPVFLAELLGGIALLAGFRVRWAALGLAVVTLGALKAHLGQGWMFTNPGGGWEYVAFLFVALVAQSFAGAGAYAVDGLVTSSTRASRASIGASGASARANAA
jgi:putative oxidoreductase